MGRLLVLLVLVPAIASASPIGDDLADAIRTKNTKAITKLLGERINARGGLWLPDAACTKRFEKARIIEKRERALLAGCLAKLELQPATRQSGRQYGRASATVLTFAPGIEIEVGDMDGEIFYIAAAGRRDPRPTLTTEALEALRTRGSTNLDAVLVEKLAAVATKYPQLRDRVRGVVTTWLQVCIDAKGAAKIDIAESGAIAIGAEVLDAAKADWAFSSFVHKKKAIAVCGLTLVTYPAAKAPAVATLPTISLQTPEEHDEVEGAETVAGGDGEDDAEPGAPSPITEPPPPFRPPPPPPRVAPPRNVAPTLLEGQRIAGDKVILPDEATKREIVKSDKDKIVGSYKLCIDDRGSVAAVTQLKSTHFPAYDQKIQAGIRTWRYRPWIVDGKAVPVCTAVTFIYSSR